VDLPLPKDVLCYLLDPSPENLFDDGSTPLLYVSLAGDALAMFSSIVDADSASVPIAAARRKTCTCHADDPVCLAKNDEGGYDPMFVLSLDDPNNARLEDIYDSNELKALSKEARPLEKKKDDEKKEKGIARRRIGIHSLDDDENAWRKGKRTNVDDETNVRKRMGDFMSNTVMELLRNKQIQVKNKSGVMVPLDLSQMQKDSGKFARGGQYHEKEIVYDLKHRSETNAKEAFKFMVHVCLKCGRISKMGWNGIFEPVLDATNFQAPCNLETVRHALFNGVSRDGSYEENFQKLPGMVSAQCAEWILEQATFSFLRDGVHKAIKGPAAVIGDVHGEMTSLQKAFDHVVLDKEVRYTRSPGRIRCGYRCQLKPFAIYFAQAPLVMLGSRFDKYKNSLWVILSLALERLKNPDHVFVLHGDHDTSEVSPLLRECQEQFGKEEGDTLWTFIKDLLDALPGAVTINHPNISNAKGWVCVHSGPPPGKRYLEDWNGYPRSVRNDRLKLVWKRDPHPDESFTLDYTSGASDSERFFGRVELSEFLRANQSKGMIRTRGETPGGIKEQWDGTLVSLTSSNAGDQAGGYLWVRERLSLVPYQNMGAPKPMVQPVVVRLCAWTGREDSGTPGPPPKRRRSDGAARDDSDEASVSVIDDEDSTGNDGICVFDFNDATQLSESSTSRSFANTSTELMATRPSSTAASRISQASDRIDITTPQSCRFGESTPQERRLSNAAAQSVDRDAPCDETYHPYNDDDAMSRSFFSPNTEHSAQNQTSPAALGCTTPSDRGASKMPRVGQLGGFLPVSQPPVPPKVRNDAHSTSTSHAGLDEDKENTNKRPSSLHSRKNDECIRQIFASGGVWRGAAPLSETNCNRRSIGPAATTPTRTRDQLCVPDGIACQKSSFDDGATESGAAGLSETRTEALVCLIDARDSPANEGAITAEHDDDEGISSETPSRRQQSSISHNLVSAALRNVESTTAIQRTIDNDHGSGDRDGVPPTNAMNALRNDSGNDDDGAGQVRISTGSNGFGQAGDFDGTRSPQIPAASPNLDQMELSVSLAASRAENECLRKILRAFDAKVKGQAALLDAANAKHGEAELTIKEQAAELAASQSEKDKLCGEVLERDSKLAKAEETNSEQTTQIVDLSGQLSAALAQAAEQMTQITEQTTQIVDLSGQLSAALAQAAEQTTQITEQTTQLSAARTQFTDQAAQLDAARAEIAALRQTVQAFDATLAAIAATANASRHAG
jgi:Calcineurin-like phosphoesterase